MTRSPDAKSRRAALDLNGHILAQFAALAQPAAGKRVERAHLVIGVGKNDAGLAGRSAAISIPAFDQIRAGLFARFAAWTMPCSR